METAETPRDQRRIMAVITWMSFPASVALTLVLIDWQDTGVAKPLWTFVLPTLSGVVGAIAGFRVQKEILGVAAGLFGVLAVPIGMIVITVLYGP